MKYFVDRMKLTVDLVDSLGDAVNPKLKEDFDHILDDLSPLIENFVKSVEQTLKENYSE